MTAQINENTQFIDETTNTPINNGYIYIGADGLDAKLNLITIYSDRDLTTVLSNPQRTGSDGRTSNKIFIPGRYSMKVENSANVSKLNDLNLGELAQTGNTILDNVLGTDAVTADASPTITTLVNNQVYIFTAANTNTGAMTLTIDATATLAIVKNHDIALVAGDVEADQTIIVVYNETDTVFELTSMSAIRSAMITGDVFTGNVGIGSPALEAWAASLTALQLGGLGALTNATAQAAGGTLSISNNLYDTGTPRYIVADEATRYYQQNGEHVFQVAVLGAEDGVITWVDAARFNNTGNVVFGLGISSIPPITAGSATVYTATLGISAYDTSRVYEVQVDEVNAGSLTMNFDAVGAKDVKLLDGTDPAAGQFAAGMIAKLLYDGTNLVLLNPHIVPSLSVNGDTLQSDATAFDIDSNLTVSTWESIGPTGSSATNIWADLDNIPDDIDWIELYFKCELVGLDLSDSFAEAHLYGRKTGASSSVNLATEIMENRFLIQVVPATNSHRMKWTTVRRIPVDTSNRFDLQYTLNQGFAVNYEMTLIGYG